MWIVTLLVLFGHLGIVECYSTESFLVITLTIVVTGFVVLIMIIYVMLVMQRRSSKVCYVKRSTRGKGRSSSSTNEHVLDSVTWSRWERRRYDMRRATNAKLNNSVDSCRVIRSESDTLTVPTVTRGTPTGTIISLTDLRNGEMLPVGRSNSNTFPRRASDVVSVARMTNDNIIIPLTISNNNNTLSMTRSINDSIPTATPTHPDDIRIIPVTRSIRRNIIPVTISNNNTLPMTKSINDSIPTTTPTQPSDVRVIPVTRSTNQTIIPVIVSNNNTLPMIKSFSEALPITRTNNDTVIPISRSRDSNLIPVTEFRNTDTLPVSLSSKEAIPVSLPNSGTIIPIFEATEDGMTGSNNDALIRVAVPSNGGHILPVTYVRVLSDGNEYDEPIRPSPVLHEEYICF